MARSLTGRLRNRFGSSSSYLQSGSSSGNPTKPPRGNARSEYSISLSSQLSSFGPKPMENLET
eukprot:scaffold7637_cov430-Prasinococcus_capsulatus_cf.AAC.2